jgi:hypothetical protein
LFFYETKLKLVVLYNYFFYGVVNCPSLLGMGVEENLKHGTNRLPAANKSKFARHLRSKN